MPTFIPGIELSRRFYQEAVRPLLDTHFPGLPHAAGLLGPGSDVLGFDTALSTDHDWGPAVRLFLRDADAGLSAAISAMLRQHLPLEFAGYPVHTPPVPGAPRIRVMPAVAHGPVAHRVWPTTVGIFARDHLGIDLAQPLAAADWLTLPAQKLREVTAGAVHYDGVGELTALRERLAYYPHDVWLYLLAAGWARIGEEEHLMPRAGMVGDELGSALIGARLVRDLIHLCFLLERQYPPYAKWFGTAFHALAGAAVLEPLLRHAQQARTWPERTAALGAAYTVLAAQQNALGLTAPLSPEVSAFHERPFAVLHAGRFTDALLAAIRDPAVQQLAARPLIGSVDQFSDSTPLRADATLRPRLRLLYDA
jgi:hypothetical protein